MNLPNNHWTAWQQEGLPTPPIIPSFRENLQFVSPLTYTTHPHLPYSLYGLDTYVNWADQGRSNLLAIGLAGHGMNSWAIHYYLVMERLQIFVQSRWGGAYTDEGRALEVLTERFEQIQSILDLASDATLEAKGITRLRVIESDMGTKSLVINSTAQEIVASPLRDAIRWLTP